MKYSRYNMIVPHKEKNYLFNTFTGEVYALDGRSMISLENDDVTLLDEETKTMFERSHVIVADEYDEKRVFKHCYNESKYSNRNLTVTLLLTWRCNFKCVYCYEGAGEKYTDTMTIKTADNIINFICTLAQRNNASHISIVLFGGEPLLNIDIGFYVIEKIAEFCENSQRTYSCCMVSNGYLLNKKTIERLIELHCSFIQITLDGTETTHNQRRIAKNGKPTFKTIVDNIRLLDRYYEKIHCQIRVNVDRTNYLEVEDLFSILERKGIKHSSIDFGIVHCTTAACADYSEKCFEEDELGPLLDGLWKKGAEHGFLKYPPIGRKLYFCGLYCNSNFTISPKGEVYKCWEMVGDQRHKIGDIDNNGNITKVNYPFYDWMTIDPLENPDCAECKYLPVCGGGCVMVSFDATGSYHGKGCFMVKGVIEKQLKHFIDIKEQNNIA